MCELAGDITRRSSFGRYKLFDGHSDDIRAAWNLPKLLLHLNAFFVDFFEKTWVDSYVDLGFIGSHIASRFRQAKASLRRKRAPV